MPLALSTVRPTIVRLDDLLSLRARTHADSPAVVAGGRTTTYAELEARAGVTARRLAALGLAQGDRVATTLSPGVEFATLLHAAAKLAATLVPLNTRLTDGERRAQVEAAGSPLVLDEPPDGPEADLGPRSPRGLDPDEPWTLLFTSGTTGRPKPVALSHRNHVASAVGSAWALGVAPDDRWLCVLPTFHVGGLAILVRSALYGTAAVVHERFDAERAAAALAGGEVTLASLVPTMLGRIVDAGVRPARDVRAILLGGASTPPDLVEGAARHGLPVVRSYGMTETASQIATTAALAVAGDPGGVPLGEGARPPSEGARPSSEGARALFEGARPLPGVDLRIAAAGEVLVRGPMVAAGSLGEDGWLHTGDLGRLDDRGLLHVEGRLDDAIVTGGENVSAGEVEDVLLGHPAVADAGVVGVPDPDWGEIVTAFVVADGTVDASDLRGHCRERIAAFKVPKEVIFVKVLPRNAVGKLERATLAASLRAGSDQ
jgi:O-succinylbenzoic acid--CoA ligase